jgi:hypothetical protein
MSGQAVSCPSCHADVMIPPYGETTVEPATPEVKSIPCFRCGEAIHGGAAVCSICGTNQETGERPGEFSAFPSEAAPRTKTLTLEPARESSPVDDESEIPQVDPARAPTRLFVKTECRFCGEIILPGAKRCVHCGKSLDAS